MGHGNELAGAGEGEIVQAQLVPQVIVPVMALIEKMAIGHVHKRRCGVPLPACTQVL